MYIGHAGFAAFHHTDGNQRKQRRPACRQRSFHPYFSTFQKLCESQRNQHRNHQFAVPALKKQIQPFITAFCAADSINNSDKKLGQRSQGKEYPEIGTAVCLPVFNAFYGACRFFYREKNTSVSQPISGQPQIERLSRTACQKNFPALYAKQITQLVPLTGIIIIAEYLTGSCMVKQSNQHIFHAKAQKEQTHKHPQYQQYFSPAADIFAAESPYKQSDSSRCNESNASHMHKIYVYQRQHQKNCRQRPGIFQETYQQPANQYI